MTQKPWRIGDLVSRSPYRLRDALTVLRDSPLNGDMTEAEQQNNFAVRLHEHGVVSYKKPRKMDFEGRKWRLALLRLGFITPALVSKSRIKGKIDPILSSFVQDIDELSGRPFEITPSGHTLIESNSLMAQQECFLRAIVGYRVIANDRIPSPIRRVTKNGSIVDLDKSYEKRFSPLHLILDILQELSSREEKSMISRAEFSFFVQTANPFDGINSIVNKIVDYRNNWNKAMKGGKAKAYERDFHEFMVQKIWKESNRKNSFRLYTDTNCTFLHLKSSGIFCSSTGRGIEISKSQETLAKMIRSAGTSDIKFEDYFKSLLFGPSLPIDEVEKSRKVILDLKKTLRRLGEKPMNINVGPKIPVTKLRSIMHDYEEKIREINELNYAKKQSGEIKEIMKFMSELSKREPGRIVPKGEAPVYLEWTIWRAFLAIGGNPIKPKRARRFSIDQDCNPVSCAPGKGPDMAFEFDDFIIVIEVTRRDGSDQEAAEGEPVRRHVAKYAQESDKAVISLFVAPMINNNTAHTFLEGVWYPSNKDTAEEILLDIVPVTLNSFSAFLASRIIDKESISERNTDAVQDLVQLMRECRKVARNDTIRAPKWKKFIASQFESEVNVET